MSNPKKMTEFSSSEIYSTLCFKNVVSNFFNNFINC